MTSTRLLVSLGLLLALTVSLAAPTAKQPLIPMVAHPLLPAPGSQYREINGFAGVANKGPVDAYTIPAGKTLYLTDLVLVRCTWGDMTDNPPPVAILTRESQRPKTWADLTAIWRAWVPADQNVMLNLRTPIEIKGPDKLLLRCDGVGNQALLLYAYGYEK